MKEIFCPYCGKEARLISANRILPEREGFAFICYCVPGSVYVFCHLGTQEPMGSLASPEKRFWRVETHKNFDKIWQKQYLTRNCAYEWLARRLGISRTDCHIGNFSVAECKKICFICKDFLREKGNEQKVTRFLMQKRFNRKQAHT